MYQNYKLRIAVLCFAVKLLCSFAGNAQVVAGIRANGKIILQGDTINVCRGNTIVFQSAALGSSNISWQFNGGLPATMSGSGPFSIRYNTTGYDTTFQNAGTGVFSDSMFIIVRVSDEKPVPGFSYQQYNLCGDENIQFSNSSVTGEPLNYLWNFDDGSTSTDQDPRHQFLSAIGLPGKQSFNVKLTVTNANACKDSISRAITIRKVPDAAIGNADSAVSFEPFNENPTFRKCNNIPSYNFKFTNRSSTIVNNASYSINWGDGSQDSVFTDWPTDAIIKHTFPIGSSTVTVSVTGKDGCTGIQKYIVFLGTVPAGGLASLGNTDICSYDSLQFAITNTANNPPGTSYSFYINDGSPIQLYKHAPPPIAGHYFTGGSCSFSSNNGLQTYTNAFGAYLTIENPCGSNSASVVPIYVSGKPRPGISIPSQVVCINNVINIKNASSFGNVIKPGGNFSSTCEDVGKKVWALFPSTGYTIVSGDTGSLNGNPFNGAAWTDGSDMLNVRFTVEGVYEVKIYIFNDRCGIDSTFHTICVRAAPQASFTMDQRTSCGPARVDLTNTSSLGACLGDVYDWKIGYSDPQGCSTEEGTAYSFTGGTKASSVSPSLLFNKIGRYIIRLTVRAANSSAAGCAIAIATDTFYVKGPPRAEVPSINSVCMSSSITPSAIINTCYSSGPYGYQWQFANGNPAISTDSFPGPVSYADIGIHAVRLIVTDSSCMLADTVNTVVNVVPLPNVVAGNDTTVCGNEPILLGVSSSVDEFVYHWTPTEGLNVPDIANPTATLYYTGPDDDTTYVYYVTASLGENCSKTDSVKITVKRSPVITINPSTEQICIGSSTQLVAVGADEYVWSPAESLSNTNTVTVAATPLITTDYTVIGVLANGCSGQKTATVVVVPDAKAEFLAPDTLACSPVNINSLITGVPFSEGNGIYNWYANDVLIGSNTTGEVPSYQLDNPGMSVVIKLITLSAAGCLADSMQKTFTTVPLVTASFTKDKFSSCAPLTASFTNTSSSLINVEFIWDFGNGITTTDVQPGPIAFNSGPLLRDTVYHVVLKATNGCDTSYFRDSIKVFAEARAKFGVDTTRGCSPFTFSIINTSLGNNNTYYWNFGDGKTDTTYSLGSFTHTYFAGAITTYTISLIAENQCSRDTQLLNIVVSPNDIEPFIVANGDQLTGCAPHTATFTNSTVGASLVTWDFGDNTPPVITPNSQGSISHQYFSAGIYNVLIRLQNDCSDTTIERSVQVFDPPSANFDADPLLICLGQSVTMTNQSVNSNSYEWIWDDGEKSSFIHGQHTYKIAGTYNIMLVAQSVHSSGFVCADTIRKQVEVLNKIPAQINVGPEKTCVPYNLKVEAGNVTGANLIEWSFYDSSTAEKEFRIDGSTAAHVYNVAGNYSVRLVVHTTPGCTDTATYQFNVFNTPRTVFEPQIISTCEHDTTINFTAITTQAGNEPVSYKWFINDQIEGTSLPFSFRFRALNNDLPSEFSVKAVAEGLTGCGDTSLSGKVMIHPLPTPSINVSPSQVLQQPDYQFTFTDLSVTNPHKTYLWDMGDKSLQTRNGQQIIYQYGDTGNYNVKLLVTDFATACKAMDSVTVSILYVPGYLQVPNAMCPGCSNFSLRQFLPLGKGLKKYRLTIYSIWGQKIFETTSLNPDGSPNIPWDGTFNGKPLQQDAYIWQIEAIYSNETEWKGMVYPGSNKPVKTGTIAVIK